MAIQLGMNAKIYFGVTGTALNGLTEMGNAREVTVNDSDSLADITVRANQGVRVQVPTLSDISIEWEMLWDNTDPAFEAMQVAKNTKATVELASLTGPRGEAGSDGIKGPFYITTFNRSEGLEDAIMAQVTATVGGTLERVKDGAVV